MLFTEDRPPVDLTHPEFMAVPLTSGLVALDHAAYVASPEVVRIHSDGRWPTEGFTIEEDARQVAHHEDDHRAGRAFTFLLLDPARQEALGCLYVNPLADYLARVDGVVLDPTLATTPARPLTPWTVVTFWIREDRQKTGLPHTVVGAVSDWLRHDWPVATHVFRALPAEVSSVTALEDTGHRRVAVATRLDPRPYLWFTRDH